jgi:hypothetical protein
MPRGPKTQHTPKQNRMAAHIEEGYETNGAGKKKAERIAWATVNKETSVAGKSVKSTAASKKGSSKSAAPQSHAKRVTAAKKAASTRSQNASH